jgi:signal transduction histidine kinase
MVKQVARSVTGASHPRRPSGRLARRSRQITAEAGRSPSMLGMLAHELRTPLTAFEVTLDILRAGNDLGDGDTERLLSLLHQSSRWMAALVNNMLTLALLEQPGSAMILSPTPLLSVIEPAMDLVQPILDRRRQRQRLHNHASDVWIRANAQFLGQALINLMTNASSHSPTGGVIDIEVRHAGTFVQIQITDQGPGIPPDELERIFERHARGSSVRHGPPGLGLGLYLTRTVVERHGGAIGVESVVGNGASFWVRLPMVAEQLVAVAGRSS